MSICVAYVTSRERPCAHWFFDSLRIYGGDAHINQLVIVDTFADHDERRVNFRETAKREIQHVQPKPTVWQGRQRLCKVDYWAASNARNTAICLCTSDYIVFVDDRCVLQEGWIGGALRAANSKYAVCGSYEKRHGMTVENGYIKHGGIIDGMDTRSPQGQDHRRPQVPRVNRVSGAWYFGGTLGMPLEWALTINGFDESMDGLGFEDCMCGLHLQNNGFLINYDPSMKIVEDRTPGELGQAMKRTSKERFPKDTQDKGHEALRRFSGLKKASHHWNLRDIRESVLRGNPFPDATEPKTDWFDNQPISDFA